MDSVPGDLVVRARISEVGPGFAKFASVALVSDVSLGGWKVPDELVE